MNKTKTILLLLFFLLLAVAAVLYIKSSGKDHFPIKQYYDYDQSADLKDSVRTIIDTTTYTIQKIIYNSTHNEKVSALLSIPKNATKPVPVIILLHGLGDRKTVDYIEVGHQMMLDNGYAVLRIDIANHGEREVEEFPFDLIDEYKYRTREMIAQTVFDLRRAVDYLATRKEIDTKRIGYYGISLGGIIGTIFCAVEPRIKVPVIVLAGGNFNLMFGKEMLTNNTQYFLSIIEPNNFVQQISPRPLLMLNAEKDEIILPIMTKLLFRKAKEPKEIIWYPTKHRALPPKESYQAGIDWYKKHL